jgi:hypothetical protein
MLGNVSFAVVVMLLAAGLFWLQWWMDKRGIL